MSIVHMDTDQIQLAIKALQQSSVEITNEIQSLSSSVSAIPWQGASRDEFIGEFETVSKSLQGRGEDLSILASRMERELAKWQHMDSRFGVTGAVGAGVGGAVMTAAMIAGETSQEPGYATSMEVGEEGQKAPGGLPDSTFDSAGEWGQEPFPGKTFTTLAVGEEGQSPIHPTETLNEDGQAVSMLTAEEGQAPGDEGRVSTMAVGEEGQSPVIPEIKKILNDPPPQTSEFGEEGSQGKMPSMPNFTTDFGEEGYNARLQWE
jgi:uncharacterized protein YukE